MVILIGVVGVAQDVTDDRKHSQELREMQYIRASQEAKVETEQGESVIANPIAVQAAGEKTIGDEVKKAEEANNSNAANDDSVKKENNDKVSNCPT